MANERMHKLLQQPFFALHMVDLFHANETAFLHDLESEDLSSRTLLDAAEADSTIVAYTCVEGTNGLQQFEVF